MFSSRDASFWDSAYIIDPCRYHRPRISGRACFYTIVIYFHMPILTGEVTRNLLHSAWMDVRARYLFTIDAVCLLPEHLHRIRILPKGDAITPCARKRSNAYSLEVIWNKLDQEWRETHSKTSLRYDVMGRYMEKIGDESILSY